MRPISRYASLNACRTSRFIRSCSVWATRARNGAINGVLAFALGKKADGRMPFCVTLIRHCSGQNIGELPRLRNLRHFVF